MQSRLELMFRVYHDSQRNEQDDANEAILGCDEEMHLEFVTLSTIC